ncbi:MAG: histidine kinase [Marinisporobacter sp.]|jgi:two-component system sensor histidine kinase YesM|nr:histidine kinase [Marinisporobacter sp.]
MSFRKKLFFSILIITTILVIAISLAFYHQVKNIVRKNYEELLTENVKNVGTVFNDKMRKIYYMTVEITFDDDIKSLILKNNNESRNFHLSNLLNKYKISNEDIDSIYLYLPKDKMIVKAAEYKSVSNVWNPSNSEWLNLIENKKEYSTNFIPIGWVDYFSSVEKNVFTYYKPIKDSNSGEILAWIAMNVDERVIYFNCLEHMNKVSDSITQIVSEDGKILSSPNIENIGKAYGDQFSPKNLRPNQFGIYHTLPFTKVQFISIVDLDKLTKNLNKSKNFIIYCVFLTGIIAFLFSNFISKKMYEPVKNLQVSMGKVANGDLKARATIYKNDEIGLLSKGFNEMVDRIEHLIGELVTERLLKKEAELEALQYQIRPHFMYNTLNSIKFAAYIQKANNIGKLLGAFIELLQITAGKKGTFLTVKDEIQIVKNYVALQSFRYMDKFKVFYDIDEESLDCYLPRIILQPFVENSILHGLDVKHDENKIWITTLIEGEKLKIVIQDNGKGMMKEEIDKIPRKENNNKNNKKGTFSQIGIGNITERLKLYYGNKASIRFESELQKGVKVQIILPVSRNKEEFLI